jgi:hypothetical protein
VSARDPHRDLLERATVALERQERTFERQARAFERQEQAFDRHDKAIERLFRKMDERDARSEAREERLMERWERSEKLFVSAIADISHETTSQLQQMSARLDDIGDAIRANTQAVLSVLDRLDPGTT